VLRQLLGLAPAPVEAVEETCPCGATFRSTQRWADLHVAAFRDAHRVCRGLDDRPGPDRERAGALEGARAR
jgi:hypothetical protein